MTVDLRHLAVILNEGSKAAEQFRSPADAGLVSALSAMAEVAVTLAEYPADDELFGVDRLYAEIRDRVL
jgi:hypothetical protein